MFDIMLLIAILASVLTVVLESVQALRAQYTTFFFWSEWVFTGLFSAEYLLRIYCAKDRKKYIFSFFGIIDAISVLPSFIDIIFGGAHYMMVVRVLRMLRIFRILKLSRYLSEADVLGRALLASRPKIIVFLGTVLTAVVVIGAIMYIIEGPEHGFIDIPKSIYWAIVTLTTVGYGDIAPATPLGQAFACLVMIMGYGIIAVPTGIVSVELHQAAFKAVKGLRCAECGGMDHTPDARFCKHCGNFLGLEL